MTRSSLLAAMVTVPCFLHGCVLAFDPDRFDYSDDGSVAPDGGDGGTESDAGDAGQDAGLADADVQDAEVDGGSPECSDGDERPCEGGSSIGECSAGTQTCEGAAWGDCTGAVGPSDEVCDGLDNNCDNIVDGIEATVACGSGQACIGGECVITMCPDFLLDCDADSSNGCEADSRTSAAHCGECDNACAWACSSALCTDPIGLTGGRYHTCSYGEAGVFCWGNNLDGQLGIGASGNTNQPTAVLGYPNAEAIAAGDNHTCAIHLGTVSCWGNNSQAQCGVSGASDRLVPESTSVTDATAVATGGGFTCAIRTTGQVVCWGTNAEGQAGVGSTAVSTHMPRPVMGLLSVSDLAAGGSHACAVSGTSLRCWGRNREGQIGNGSSTTIFSSPQPVSGVSSPAEVALGRLFSCARTTAGAVFCWGDNAHGQLGTGTTGGTENTPQAVVSISGVDQITAGRFHACARIGDRVSCWGDNRQGQLALPAAVTNSATPQLVAGLTGVVAVAAGGEHTCARLDTGHVQCWGRGLDGQIGDGDTMRRHTPTAVLPP